jgi:excinuclease UvrABC ATPase subunit
MCYIFYFCFNTHEGRFENCDGLGYITSNMLYFKDIVVTRPVCGVSSSMRKFYKLGIMVIP